MPKTLDYPRASLKRSLLLAKAVDDLGGSCTEEMCADRMGKKISGAFSALVSAASRFGLVVRKKGQLTVTDAYRNYKLSYSEGEREQVLRSVFLGVPVFRQIVDRFGGRKLPVDLLDKLLIREFEVGEPLAARVARYFVEGARLTGLLGPDNTLAKPNGTGTNTDDNKDDEDQGKHEQQDKMGGLESPTASDFVIRFKGPGLDSTVTVAEEDDLAIVEAVLAKIRKKLGVERAEP